MDYIERQALAKKLLKELRLRHNEFLSLLELHMIYSQNRINTQNNGGPNDFMGFMGWLKNLDEEE